MTIRFKLTLWAIGVILAANAVLSIVVVCYLEDSWQQEIQRRVSSDLNSARAAYDGRIDHIGLFLRAASRDGTLQNAVEKNDLQLLASHVQELYPIAAVDFIDLLDTQGRVIYRARNPERKGDDLSLNPLVAAAVKHQNLFQGTVILTAEQLRIEGDELAKRAEFELLPTPAAREVGEKSRNDGMVVAAVVPLLDKDGKILGFLYAGELLNRRNEIVDKIKAQAFSKDTYEGRDIGTVTIFQGDLRIATNVMREDDQRAVGTRMSRTVAEEVLDRGTTWTAPAFVVNAWYFTAYEPIRDPAGRIIGALYVGLLQAPFTHQQNVVSGVFLLMVIIATIAMLAIIFIETKRLLRPMGKIVDMAQRVSSGDMTARVGVAAPGELGVLCRAIDSMADAVAEREEQLKQATRQQIGRSEKLASIGRLAAGVAHEINNPLTGVLTFAHLLRDKPNMDAQDREDLELIIRETSRAADIVRGLLDFSRERVALMQHLDINEVVSRTVQLIRNQKLFDGIVINENLGHNLPEIEGDMNRLQQVLLNLTLNSCEAMPEGGTISITTSAKNGQILVEVADTGCGITPEQLERIFEPFYTTKPVGQGTGLGLAVSYGIVEQHGGVIEVESEAGKGSRFTIVLPVRKYE